MIDPSAQDNGPASVSVNVSLGTPLMNLLTAPEIEPGIGPSYQLCKEIYSYHPLGAILADAPITLAQSQPRTLTVPTLAEDRIVKQFQDTWDKFSKVGATVLLHNLFSMARMYGIASVAIGELGKNPRIPLDMGKIADADLFVNILDPLNTAGSLVLNQDPNSSDFLKQNMIRVNGVEWHPSRTLAQLNEQPLYIEWSSSAFGFVGRSVYQRALFPLKTFLQTMITDQLVTQKAGLLIYKSQAPSSFIDKVMLGMAGFRRQKLKEGTTGQVAQIGIEEDLETLNMQNLDGAAKFARDNAIKNIASAAGMPAAIINNETLTEGFGEGTEDAKTIIRYLNYIRKWMQPGYDFMDRIIQRKAWTPEFYKSLQHEYKEYAEKPFETALHEWIQAFRADWPNLEIEPDSEKSKAEDVKMKSVIALLEVLLPTMDPENKVNLILWAADNVNELEALFTGDLQVDELTLQAYLDENAAADLEAKTREPDEPAAFAARA